MIVAVKIDGVSPVDNRPSVNYLNKFLKKKYIYILHMTHDTQHVVKIV